MKILFYDGMMSERYFSLRDALKEEHYGFNANSYDIDAVYGPGKCKIFLDYLNFLLLKSQDSCFTDRSNERISTGTTGSSYPVYLYLLFQ